MCRSEIKVLDCTIRDGGLVNNHQFDDDFVHAVYNTCVAAGVDYMELGYKNSERMFDKTKCGAWRFCNEESIRRIVGDNATPLKLAVMIDAGKTDWQNDVIPKQQSVIDTVRVAFYVHQVPEATDMIRDAHEKGYEVWANLMAASTATEEEIDKVLEILAETPASVLVVVDSYGSMYAEQIERLVTKYLSFGRGTGKEVGIHAHNNQQLAFANSIEAIIHGANRVDASLGGLGRGAGNCPMELMLGFLRNPKFKLRPIYDTLERCVAPLQKNIEWGPYPEFIMTGQNNQHPRAAIEARENPQTRDHYVEFYDRIMMQQ
ncbi:MAG: aldolase catalytic domain-containing protein [Planctomycetaceae bacterium]|jgi:4-hydroxy 2-oxovalerate aldolase|nr:aldolase catalytic domain-containing protein [Planctomycetaceae bacterium]